MEKGTLTYFFNEYVNIECEEVLVLYKQYIDMKYTRKNKCECTNSNIKERQTH